MHNHLRSAPIRATSERARSLILVALLAIGAQGIALAEPILLATHTVQVSREFDCHACPAELGYYDINAYDPEHPTVALFGFLDGVNFGVPIARGSTGIYDFDATNAPGFAALAGRLTDDINGRLVFHFPGFDTNARAGEDSGFGPNHYGVELLTGRTIDFLRFVFDERVSETDHDSTLIALSAQWQVWGSGDAIPTDPPIHVPEPATFALTLAGLALIRLTSRRRPVRVRESNG